VSLTQQFLIISILPFSFIGMVVYMWRSRIRRRQLLIRWTATLIAAAIWSSSFLRFYGGVSFSESLIFSWGVAGSYVFGMAALGALSTTYLQFSIPRTHGQTALTIGAVLWLASLILDSTIWRYQLPDLALAGQTFRHFDLWAAVWTAGWFMPIVAAWVLTQQIRIRFPTSLYRNQLDYWLLFLALFAIGGALVSIRQPGQPAWQEIGLIFIIMAMVTGSISIANSHLPNLQLALRQMLSRLSGTLILFGLTWAALRFIVQGVTDLPAETNPNLILTVAAALFAGLFTIIYRLVNTVTRRLFVPSRARRELVMADYAGTLGNLPEPSQIGQMVLRLIRSHLSVDDAWFFGTEEGVAGGLIFRSVAHLDIEAPGTAQFDGGSPFVRYLRRNSSPLTQFDIDGLSNFDELSESEREVLREWRRVLYVPLRAGDRLVGMMALSGRSSGEAYERDEFDFLESLGTQISPLIVQAQNLASLRQINDFVFQQNQVLARDNRHLNELTKLYFRFSELISPDLRQPFAFLSGKLQLLQENSHEAESRQLIDGLLSKLDDHRKELDQLIAMSAQFQKRESFDFQPVHLDELAGRALRFLKPMVEARRVHIDFQPDAHVPPVLGDEQQLREAFQHLLHNAIKFNKIGGRVQLKYLIENGQLCVHIIDDGVGIRPERLESIWEGFSNRQNENGRGTGLGLVLSQFIISAHGGHIEAQSKYGAGSTFSVYLPLLIEE
jgi:signal transduction histidine kinase